MKLVTIAGARPQFIKIAPVSKAIKRAGGIKEIILHTGQHFDDEMSENLFRQLNISTPKYNLGINSISHGQMVGEMLIGIEKVLQNEKPDYVLVYGDTNSTLAGALAARKLNIRIGHVEAGLRSFNLTMPEEINRILTDRISDILFCPTEVAYNNLRDEGYDKMEINFEIVGDVMFDAALLAASEADKINFDLKNDIKKDFILCTIHREENTNDPEVIKSLLSLLNEISNDYQIIFPVHPRLNSVIKGFKPSENLTLVKPLGYYEMIWLIKNSSLIMTDSGGLQKEAYFFNKYCITLRNETEWIELVTNGFNIIAGNNKSRIIEAVDQYFGKTILNPISLYGNGDASQRIANLIKSKLT